MAVSIALGTAAFARADDRASVSTSVYTDSDGLTVVHPSASGTIDEGETRVDLRYDADVISAATVDVRTSASVRPFEEVRNVGSIGVAQTVERTVELGGDYALSISPDHQSHSLGARARAEDDARIHRFGIDLRGAYESVGRAGDPAPTGEQLALGLAVAWTGVLTSWLVADLSAALEWRHGYLESPYRFVTIWGDGAQLVRVPEDVPDDRVRGAITAALRAALADRAFARASYRLHADDWGIVGHTVELEATFEPVDDWLVAIGGRILVQRGASFYDGTYRTLPELPIFRTRDRELASSASGAVFLRTEVPLAELPEGWRLFARARAELLYFRYFGTPLLPERLGLVTGLTLAVER